jgi:hypothetical protein
MGVCYVGGAPPLGGPPPRGDPPSGGPPLLQRPTDSLRSGVDRIFFAHRNKIRSSAYNIYSPAPSTFGSELGGPPALGKESISNMFFSLHFLVYCGYRTTVLVFNTCDGVADYMRVAAKHGGRFVFFTNRPI